VNYKTVPIGSGDQRARPQIDYVPVEGVLQFKHNESSKSIVIKIIEHADKEEERNEIFGLKLFGAEPAEVKISKKDTLVIQIITDEAKKKQAEALNQLLERINREERITWGE